MSAEQTSKAVAKLYFVSTKSNETKQARMATDEMIIKELQAKARERQRNYPSGYQGL